MSQTRSERTFSFMNSLRLFFTGFAMGAADIVPGVSGGTMAFILGIYEELIYSIKVMSGEVIALGIRGRIKEAWQKIPFAFLFPLGFGLLAAIGSLSKVIAFLLHDYPSFIWSFFFGLVIASIVVVRKRVVTWDIQDYGIMGVTAIVAYLLVGVIPVETPSNLLITFLSGAIAICAMILPGISGSFLLVILGKYEQILQAVLTYDFLTLGVFAAGAALGLALFSRVLSWLFRHYHDVTVAALIGFMIGSLRKVWPWKEVLVTRLNSHGELVTVVDRNILP
ncbi:DUF368 domain-containing protein, partial [Candidatus Woesebacteria bacterium]|nr:DUF368 domain-containing protein [Candidatus Woesebacteria bacterium]